MQISGAALGPISERATIKMKLRHIILSMTFLVSGCVGLVSLTRTERETYPKRAFGMYCPDLANIGEFRLCSTSDAALVTKESVLARWGEPKTRDIREGKEFLLYNDGLAWRGLVVMVIVPIPLMLPVGRNEVTLVFLNGRLVEVAKEGAGSSFGAACGYFSAAKGFTCEGI